MRKFLVAGTVFAALLGSTNHAIPQPAPVPAVPDTARLTSTSLSGSTGPVNVGFDIYGDGADYGNWIEVWVNGVRKTAVSDYTLSSPSGSLSSLARPITNAQITFTAAQTGTVVIVGSRRPRRTTTFAENRGVPARDLNQVLNDLVTQNRESWDKLNNLTGRVVQAPPGETMTVLPPAATRASKGMCFDASGNVTSCASVPTTTFAAGSGITFSGVSPTTITINGPQIYTALGLGCSGTGAPNTTNAGFAIGVFASCFGVKTDGVTNDTAAWNSAITFANANPGTMIIASPGTSIITALNNITAVNTFIACIGGPACILQHSGSPALVWAASGGGLKNMVLSNSGAACNISVQENNGTVNHAYDDVRLASNIGTFLKIGTSGANVGNDQITNLNSYGGSGLNNTAACPIIDVRGPGGALNIFNTNLFISGAPVVGRNFMTLTLASSFWDQLYVVGNQLQNFNKHFQVVMSGTTPRILNTMIANNFLNNCNVACIDITGSASTTSTFHLFNNSLDGNVGGAPTCVNIVNNQVAMINIIGNRIGDCAGNGITIGSTTAVGVKISDNIIFDVNVALSGTTYGILVTGDASGGQVKNILINNNQVAVDLGGISPANLPTYGIGLVSTVAGGVGFTNAMITGNQARGSTAAYNIDQTSTTSTTIFKDNQPKATTTSSIAVGASPFAYKAGAAPETVYLSAGTVSNITQNAVTICGSPCVISLEPGETVTVTYSVAPTMIKTIH